MCEQDELEAHITAVRLDYRRLWLDSAAELGLVASRLADALGWQPSHDQPPNALELAELAAIRLAALEQAVSLYQPRLKGRRQREYA